MSIRDYLSSPAKQPASLLREVDRGAELVVQREKEEEIARWESGDLGDGYGKRWASSGITLFAYYNCNDGV